MKLDFKFEYSELSTADLNIDAIYKGGIKGNSSDDIFNKLLGLENSGGFRALKSRTTHTACISFINRGTRVA